MTPPTADDVAAMQYMLENARGEAALSFRERALRDKLDVACEVLNWVLDRDDEPDLFADAREILGIHPRGL